MSGPQHRRPQPPVPEMELLVIDGDNLLHRVRGMRDEAGLHWLLPRLKAWRPASVQILLMLDGSPGPGVGRRQQVVPGIQMQHSGRLDGDTAIVELVRARGYAERTRTVVVTDDRQLSDRARYSGVLVRRLDWLIDLLARPNPDAAVALAAPGRGAGVQPAQARDLEPRVGEAVAGRRWASAAASRPARPMRRRPSSATRRSPTSPGSRAGARPPSGAIPSAPPRGCRQGTRRLIMSRRIRYDTGRAGT